MKKSILFAIAGVVVIFLTAGVYIVRHRLPPAYEHRNYISAITSQACYVCGTNAASPILSHRGEDNVGIVNLNTFDLLHLEINRYDDHRNQIEEPAGFLSTDRLLYAQTKTYIHAFCDPDSLYACVRFSGVQYAIARDSVETRLCQNCLDSINQPSSVGSPPAEFAVIGYEDGTIRPLLCSCTRFSLGNFSVDCTFEDTGKIELLIHAIG